MFYKKSKGEWYFGLEIMLPTTPETRLTENNRENNFDWEWHDTPPQEYLDWKEEQENKHITFN